MRERESRELGIGGYYSLLIVFTIACELISDPGLITHIQPDGSAALSGEGLKVGQQILQVNSRSLHGLSHKDAVSTIKSGFEGPINKTTITFIVLDPE